jgi:uncharacterized protein
MNDIDPEKMAEYRRTAQKRRAAERAALLAWREEALQLADRATAVLREQFGATEVFLFGSLAHEIDPDSPNSHLPIHTRSDLDLAAWGIPEKAYLRAVSRLLDLSDHISIDLVRLEEATPAMQQRIQQQGKRL